MDRKNTASLAALAALGTALTVGSALPATAGKEAVVPPPPAEAGCYDLAGNGKPGFQRFLKAIDQTERVAATPLTPALYEKAVITQSDRGVVNANLSLGGVSCPEATYVVEVFAATPEPDGSYRLLARNSQRGDGLGVVVVLPTVITGYDAQSVRLSGYIQDAYGRTIDTSDLPLSHEKALFTAPDDGLPPGGGGQQFWG
jgi:hypothetical protein